MSKKVLVNAITVENGNLIPLLLKSQEWQKNNVQVTIFANIYLKKRIDRLGVIRDYKFIELKNDKRFYTKLQFVIEAVRRNIIALSYIKVLLTSKFDVVYSISSVTDLTILPLILKLVDKRIKWAIVFDNIVPINNPGPKLIRFLGWIFFHISIIIIKKADVVYAISEDLKKYLVSHGIENKKVIVTGNAIESDIIKKVDRNNEFYYDAIYVGRINETKGIYEMLEVLKIVVNKHDKFTLGIVGEGDKETMGSFKVKIGKMNLSKNVKFLGYLDGTDKFKAIKKAKTFWFLSFSEHESFGVALLEAVSSGVPCFSYRLKPFVKIYKHSEVRMSPIHDYKDVAKNVLATFATGNFNNENGTRLLDKYSWDYIAQKERKAFSS